MKKGKFRINKKESLKENLRHVIPLMYDDFFLWKKSVSGYPLRKTQLHEMRKAGKPLRYAMELGEYCFGADFTKCLDELKQALDLMGDIHDADVMIPDLTSHINEIRGFNRTITSISDRIPTRPLRNNVNELRNSRRELFLQLTELLNDWETGSFRNRIISATLL
ncbi:MAG: CHAD domain-containing protein [Ignavibacteria bacterium]|nr:CHAD domain-containing protein [Ignavibacteria bacterium]